MNDPVFQSVFRNEFEELVALKRALGFKYETDALSFGRIDAFFCDNGLTEKSLSKEICDAWCKKRSYETASNHASRISSLRVFCKYINSLGLPAYIPPSGITKHPPKYNAHILRRRSCNAFLVLSTAAGPYHQNARTVPWSCLCFFVSFIRAGCGFLNCGLQKSGMLTLAGAASA